MPTGISPTGPDDSASLTAAGYEGGPLLTPGVYLISTSAQYLMLLDRFKARTRFFVTPAYNGQAADLTGVLVVPASMGTIRLLANAGVSFIAQRMHDVEPGACFGFRVISWQAAGLAGGV
jgi:hypothetical protein